MTESRKRFEEWARRNRWHDLSRFASLSGPCYVQDWLQQQWVGWSARDSEVERLREALKWALGEIEATTQPHDWTSGEQYAAHIAARSLLSSQVKESGK